MPHDIATTVTRNIHLGHGSYLVEFAAPALIDGMRSAQFFMIGVPGAEMLLRRPFSVCGLPDTFDDGRPGTARVLYKVYGKGTALLASLNEGASLTVLGPLGNGFELPAEGSDVDPLIVAGGIGSAPFPLLIRELAGRAFTARMFYGARSEGDLPLLSWFREQTGALTVSTDDGSAGVRGLVTEPLDAYLREAAGNPSIFACGPQPMLRAVAEIAARHRVPCQLSLEAHMACGFGVCLGCVVPVHGEDGAMRYERLCVEGPVMPAQRLAW